MTYDTKPLSVHNPLTGRKEKRWYILKDGEFMPSEVSYPYKDKDKANQRVKELEDEKDKER